MIQVGCIGWTLFVWNLLLQILWTWENYGKCWNSQHTSLWTYKSSLLAKAQLPSFCKEVDVSENNFHVFSRFCQVPLTSISPISVTLTWQEDCSACICCISKLHEAPEISWQTPRPIALPETPLQMLVAASPETPPKIRTWNPLKPQNVETSHKKVKHGETSKLNWWVFQSCYVHVPIMYRKKSSISWMPRLEELEMGYHGAWHCSAEPKIHYLPSNSVLWMTTRWAGNFLGSKTIASR